MKRIISFLCTFVPVLMLNAQSVDSLLEEYGKNYPQEKVYLHLDKHMYAAGETIWFKGYIFSGNLPGTFSYNFYVDLINPSTGEVITRKFYPTEAGTVAGTIELPENFKLPAVLLRAYTPWMLNFDQDFVYSKIVRVVGPGATQQSDKPVLPPALSLLPEGGNFIAGIDNNIAFKGTDGYGRPIEFTGEVKDSKGNVILSFEPEHDGMGMFGFVPEENEKYTAIWEDADGNTYSTDLPGVLSYGANLHILYVTSHIPFKVERSKNAPSNFASLNVVASFNQQVIYQAKADLKNVTEITGYIPVDDLAAGIVTITLFDEYWKPVAERIVFVHSDKYNFLVNVNVVEKNLEKRGLNTVELEVPEEIFADMSISITDELSSVSSEYEDNILSRLLLTGDLKGKIHAPGYYFVDNDELRQEHLDLVMLTNGWRRYDWESILAGKLPDIKYQNQEYLSIKGEIEKIAQKKIPESIQLNLFTLQSDSTRDFIAVNMKNGVFEEHKLLFFDTLKVYYQFDDKSMVTAKTKVKLQLNNTQAPLKITPEGGWKQLIAVDHLLYDRTRTFANELAELLKKSNTQWLEPVAVKGVSRQRFLELDKLYTSGFFSGYDGYPIDVTNDPTAMSSSTIFHYLVGKIPGLQIVAAASGATLMYRGGSPVLFLDQARISSEDMAFVPVSDIAYVKFFRPPFYGGPAVGGGTGVDGTGMSGALAIYTRRGADIPLMKDFSGLEMVSVAGYSPIKKFYSPDYSVEESHHALKDVRSTLYWNPYILTDEKNRKVQISFYNNDISSSYRIILEGVTHEGKLARIEKVIR